MFRTIRSLHLCAGLFCVVFLVMYAVSAVQMTHGTWLHMQPRVTERSVELHFFACELLGEPTPLLGQTMRWIARGELASLQFAPADARLIAALTRPA